MQAKILIGVIRWPGHRYATNNLGISSIIIFRKIFTYAIFFIEIWSWFFQVLSTNNHDSVMVFPSRPVISRVIRWPGRIFQFCSSHFNDHVIELPWLNSRPRWKTHGGIMIIRRQNLEDPRPNLDKKYSVSKNFSKNYDRRYSKIIRRISMTGSSNHPDQNLSLHGKIMTRLWKSQFGTW